MKNKPNVVLIMTDQMRGDCMSLMGHKNVKTPNLDTLALKGTRFTHSYTACPSCIPARAALHTGLNPEHHKRVGYQDRVDWDYTDTLASRFAQNGYYTQAVGKMHVHPIRNNLGFHNVVLHDGTLTANRDVNLPFYEQQENSDDYFYYLKKEKGIHADVYDTGLDSNSWVVREWPYEESLHPTNWVTELGIDFLRRRDTSQPFFLFMSYVRPHPPLDAPKAFFDIYRNMKLEAPVIGDWAKNKDLSQKGFILDSETGPIDAEMRNRMLMGYYACISHLDNQIGRFMLALQKYHLDKDTVIMFVSDHGEMLGDHLCCRKVLPYQGSIHIPFFITGCPKLPAGETIDDLVELMDVLPTLISAIDGKVKANVDGEDLLNPMREKRHYIHGEHSSFGDNLEIGNQFIVTKQDKYIWFMETGEEQYFDLIHDPKEERNLICDEKVQTRVSYLRELLIRELEYREEGYVYNGKLIAGREQRNILEQTGG